MPLKRHKLEDGRVRLHYFHPSGAAGPIKPPGGVMGGRIHVPPATYTIACAPDMTNRVNVLGSEDPRAVTCPECEATELHKSALALYDDAQNML
jgi:hypothetical protein